MTVKLSAPALQREYTQIKAVVNSFDASTPTGQVQAEMSKLESLNERVTALVQSNITARQTLSMAIPGIPMLINKCKAMISTAPVAQTTTTTTMVRQNSFNNRVSQNDENVIFLTSGRPQAPGRRLPSQVPGSIRLRNPVAAPASAASVFADQQPSAPVITKIIVKCQIPFGHTLKIHGEGGDLDWKQGKELEKLDDGIYAYSMEGVTGKVEYKLVLDGATWETCPNRSIEAEKSQEIVPALFIPTVPVIVNFGDSSKKLFIRGTGPGMSWEKGIELKFVQGKFVLETNAECGNFEFKVLINDQQWSKGEQNFKAENGKTLEITPNF